MQKGSDFFTTDSIDDIDFVGQLLSQGYSTC